MKSATTAALLAVALAACAEGITPPEPTETALIDDGDGTVEFLFGGMPPCELIHHGSFDTPFSCEDGCPEGEQCQQRDNTSPPMLVSIPAFRIDRHEVTNVQYRFCVEMGVCRRQAFDTLGNAIIADYAGDEQFNDYPALVLNVDDARTYCELVGKRLPTEFEWERVAGGPTRNPDTGEHDITQKRLYSFLEPEQPITDCTSLDVALKPCSEATQTAPVTTSADDFVEEAGQRIYDLGGNMAEWTSTDLPVDLILTCQTYYDQCIGLAANGCEACCAPLDPEDEDSPTTCDESPFEPFGVIGNISLHYSGEEADGDGSNGCYAVCAGEKGSTAICEPRWRPGQPPLHPSDDLSDVAPVRGRRVVRGGSYNLSDDEICTARTGNRDSETVEGLESHPWLGVRCACDAGACP